MDETGCEVICDASVTPAVNGLRDYGICEGELTKVFAMKTCRVTDKVVLSVRPVDTEMCLLQNCRVTHKGVFVVVPQLDGAILADSSHVPAVIAVDAGGRHHATTPLALGLHDALVLEGPIQVPDPHCPATKHSHYSS